MYEDLHGGKEKVERSGRGSRRMNNSGEKARYLNNAVEASAKEEKKLKNTRTESTEQSFKYLQNHFSGQDQNHILTLCIFDVYTNDIL